MSNSISIISGFILGYIICNLYIKKCINYHGPNSNIIQKYIYLSKDNKYYKFIPEVCICPLRN